MLGVGESKEKIIFVPICGISIGLNYLANLARVKLHLSVEPEHTARPKNYARLLPWSCYILHRYDHIDLIAWLGLSGEGLLKH